MEEKDFVVSLAIDGRYYAHVKAKSPAEAVEKANNAAANADFGELEAIDWSVDHVEDQNGRIIDSSEI